METCLSKIPRTSNGVCDNQRQTARNSLIPKRRDVRVVEGARLESVCRGNSTEGSNPSLSAKLRFAPSWRLARAYRASRGSLSLTATRLESLSLRQTSLRSVLAAREGLYGIARF